MNERFRAFVLNVSDYRDNDVLLQVVCKEYGFISLVAKGAKKTSAKWHFTNLGLYEFIIDYQENKTIFSLHNSKLIRSFYVDNDLFLLAFENILLELTLKIKELFEDALFDNLLGVFENINRDNMYKLGCFYVAYILKICGISPYVDGCVACNNPKVVSFSSLRGGFVCLEHLNGESVMQVERLRKFRLVNRGEVKDWFLLRDFVYDEQDFYLIMDFLCQNGDFNVRAYTFFKQL